MVSRLLLILLLFFFSSLSFAQPNGHAFGYDILKNPLGKLVLKVRVETSGSGLYLGVSLYPPNASKLLEEGTHFSFPVKQGLFVKEFEIDSRYDGGTFEAALWTGKMLKQDCPPDDLVCQKLGYKHTGMASYLWGTLKAR